MSCGCGGSPCGCVGSFPAKPTLTKTLVPYTDRNSEARGAAEVWWWDAYTMLSGLQRYHYLVVVDHLVTPQGLWVAPNCIKTFVYYGTKKFDCCKPLPDPSLDIPKDFGGKYVNPEVRSSIAAQTPYEASRYKVLPIMATLDTMDMYSVTFRAFGNESTAPGITTEALTEDPNIPGRYIASDNVRPASSLPSNL